MRSQLSALDAHCCKDGRYAVHLVGVTMLPMSAIAMSLRSTLSNIATPIAHHGHTYKPMVPGRWVHVRILPEKYVHVPRVRRVLTQTWVDRRLGRYGEAWDAGGDGGVAAEGRVMKVLASWRRVLSAS